MKTYTIHQDGAGNYEITAQSEEDALHQMAENIVDSLDNDESRDLAFGTQDRDEQIEKTCETLSIVTL